MMTDDKIFVSIASYSDPVLPQTLDSCLAMARYPENLRFGICWQFDENRPVNLDRFRSDKRFLFRDYACSESDGGSWARSITQELWDGEAYGLQIDSHMLFAPGWDASLLRIIRSLPADMPLITMNAPLFSADAERGVSKQTDLGIRSTKLAGWAEHEGWSPWFDWGVRSNFQCSRSRFISGNFVFAPGQWMDDVRQDPEHYYWGEEFAITLRSYTHGYDFFLPDDFVAWHMEHVHAPPRRHWEHGDDVVNAKNAVAFERLRKLAYSDDQEEQDSLGRYGLGQRRSRKDYEIYAGMDFANKTAHPHVFTGESPDPVTIKSESDWALCMTADAYANSTRH